MVYRIDNRPKNHRGRYTVLGLILGLAIAFGGLYVYDNHKDVINGNVDSIKQFAIKQIPKDSPIIQVTQGDSVSKPIEQQPIQTSPVEQTQTVSIDIPSLEKQIHEQINQIRQNNGLSPLNYNQLLSTIARNHSQDMAQNDYLEHISLSGKTLLDRYKDAQYPCFAWSGENIEQNYVSSNNLKDSIIQTWLNSPDHAANILSNHYLNEGIGIAVNGDNVLITEDFC